MPIAIIDASLSLDDLNNELLLLNCLHAYQDVAPDDLGNEGLVFRVFVTANNDAYRPDATAFGSLVASIRRLSQKQQHQLCFECIKEFNANE